MSHKSCLAILTVGVLTICCQPATAAPIVSPTGAVINNGGPGFGSIADTFNQSGLFSGFVSGVTDYDAYVATAPLHDSTFSGNEWFSNTPPPTTPVVVTYDLGSVLLIDALALWNEEASGIATLDLETSTDGITFSSLLTGIAPVDNPPHPAPYAVESFGFAPMTAQFVRFIMTGPQVPADFDAVAIGEVAFRVSDVPEPTSMALFGLTALGMGVVRRRRRSGEPSVA